MDFSLELFAYYEFVDNVLSYGLSLTDISSCRALNGSQFVEWGEEHWNSYCFRSGIDRWGQWNKGELTSERRPP